MSERGLRWLTPYESAKRERRPWPRRPVHKRRWIETVIGQVVVRYRANRVWARDRWL